MKGNVLASKSLVVGKLARTLYFLMLLLIIGTFFIGGYEAFAAPGDQTPVTFPDANLETVIREFLNKPEGAIYTSDLESLTRLSIYKEGISDLTGLEYCTNLTELHLGGEQISDLSPLSSLTRLIVLYLGEDQITDISPLSSLTQLTVLRLGENQISDLSPLSKLTSLTRLYLYKNRISDISPLSGLTRLTVLYLGENQISDLSPLGGLTNLQNLDLCYNQISDVSPLASLTRLTELCLMENRVTDISPLARLPDLQNLNLPGNRITNVSPLIGLPALRRLNLRFNPLSVVSASIYVPVLRLKGVYLRMTSPPVLLIIIIGIVLALIAIRMMSMADWRLAHRVWQLSLIAIAAGLACYFAASTEPGTSPYYLLSFFPSVIVGFGAITTFWLFRGKSWDLVGWSFIVLAVACFVVSSIFAFGSVTVPASVFIGFNSGPGLAAAGVLFLLRRFPLKVAIIGSVLTIIVGLGFVFIVGSIPVI